MLAGLCALMRGRRPQQVHARHLAVHVDAVEWVEPPTTPGTSQCADGGLMGNEPYVATGKHILRMGPACCRGCRYDPAQRVGETACPFTTLYRAVLMRPQARLAAHPRMAPQAKNAARLDDAQRQDIRARAAAIRDGSVE